MSIDIRLIGGGGGGGGAVTSVAGRTGAVTLTSTDIGGLGTAAVLDVGTTASKVVQLDASARLPAVDGSQLTNLPSAPVTSVAGKTGAVTLTISDITDFEGLYTNIEYINDNVVDIQAGINAAASNAIVWVGPGSYAGSTLTLTDKDMLKLQGEGAQTGAAGIVELTSRGIAISGSSSTRNVVTGFQVEGSFTVTGTQGRHHIRNCQLLSGLAIDAVPNFMVVRDCEITGAVTISAATTGTIYFIGCTFTSATFTNSASASLVIVTQCTGFPAASVASVTPYGTIGLSTGAAVNFNSQIVLPYATSFTGRTGELNNNAGFITSAQAPVQSVAGKTGAVTLSASDISGLATVATTGAYSDLSGLPTLGTAAALDVGTTALNVVQLDASAKLPAVDGSQLTNLPSAPVTSVAGKTGAVTLSASDISGLATVATTGAYSDLSGTPSLATVATSGAYSDLSGTPSLATVATTGAYSDLSGLPTLGTAAALDVGTTASKVVQLDASARLPAVDGSQLTNLPSAPVTSVAGKTGAVTLTASDISGLATVATTGAYSDLSGKPTLGTAAALDVGTTALNVVQLDASAKLPAVDGSQLTNLPSAPVTSVAGKTGAVTLSASDISGLATVATTGAYSDLSGKPTLATVATSGAYADLSGTPSLATVATTGAYSDLSGKPTLGTAAALDVGTTALKVVQLDASAKLPAVDGSQLTNLPSAPVTSVAGKTGAVTLTASDISGLATVATTGAYSDLSGKPTLATVATTGAYSDLSGKPTLGTAAALDVGTTALKVVQLDASAKLPAVDGSQLTNLSTGSLTYESKSANFTAVADYHYSVSATSGTITCTLPARSGVAAGKAIRFKLYDATNSLVLTPTGADTIDGLASYTLSNIKQSITLIRGAADWEIV